MKSANAALLALFATNQQFEQFDLYTITLTSGLVLRYATCSYDVAFGGNIWLCSRSIGGLVIDQSNDTSGPRGHWTHGFSTGTWAVTIMPRPGDLIGSVPFTIAVRSGILDEATIRVDRGYVTSWPAAPALTIVPVGIVNVFFGFVAEIDFGRGGVEINMNDPRSLLAINMPRNLYSAGCRYSLYSPACTMLPANFAVNGVVTGTVVNANNTAQTLTILQQISAYVSNQGLPNTGEATYIVPQYVTVAGSSQSNSQMTSSVTGFADGYFSLGYLVFNTGLNAGLRAMVRSSFASNGAFVFLSPAPYTMNPGDTFTVYPGCDKQQATCANKFNNLLNFGGFPFVPAVETAT